MLAEVFFGRDEPAVFFGPVLQISRVRRALLLFGVFVCGTHLFFNGFVPSRRPTDKNKNISVFTVCFGIHQKHTVCVDESWWGRFAPGRKN